MPGTKLRAVLVGGFFLLIVAGALSIQQLYFMSMALFLLPLMSYLLGAAALSGLFVTRAGPMLAQVGEELEFTLRVTNTGRVRRTFIWVYDQLPSGLRHAEEEEPLTPVPGVAIPALEPVIRPARGARLLGGLGPGEETVVRYPVVARRRGRHLVGPTELMSSDPLGLFPRRRQVGRPSEVLVLPQTVPLPRFVLGVGAYDSSASSRPELPGEGTEFRALRDYVPGDDLRRVHWKTSARRGRLTVIEHDAARAVRLVIVLDLHAEALVGDEEDNTLETAVTVAASLAGHALAAGGTVRLIARGAADWSVETIAAPAQLPRILEALARVEAGGPLRVSEVVEDALGALAPGACVAILSPATGPEMVATAALLRGAGCRPVNVVIRADMYLAPDDRRALESGLGQAYAAFSKELAGVGSRVFEIGAGDDIMTRMSVPRVPAA